VEEESGYLGEKARRGCGGEEGGGIGKLAPKSHSISYTQGPFFFSQQVDVTPPNDPVSLGAGSQATRFDSIVVAWLLACHWMTTPVSELRLIHSVSAVRP